MLFQMFVGEMKEVIQPVNYQRNLLFLGIEKHSIVSIGTYGCIQGKEYRRYFYEGLKAMLEELEPKVVLVYGAMPDDIFEEVKKTTEFVQNYDWISSKKSPKAVFS